MKEFTLQELNLALADCAKNSSQSFDSTTLEASKESNKQSLEFKIELALQERDLALGDCVKSLSNSSEGKTRKALKESVNDSRESEESQECVG